MPRKRHENPYKRHTKNGKVRWVARYTAPDGRRLSAGTFERKTEAQDAIDRAYEQPERTDTVGAYLPRWLDEHPVSERTMRTNRWRIGAVLDAKLENRPLADWPLHELRRRHAKDLIAHMLTVQGRAPEGCRAILRALSSMFEDAITDEMGVDSNPWRGVRVRDDDRRATKQSRKPRLWDWQDMHAFAAKAGPHEPMIRMLADCGLRIGELFALERERQDLKAGEFRVTGSAWEGRVLPGSRTKRHDRVGPIPLGCLELLRRMPVPGSPWLFPSPMGRLYRLENFRRDIWIPTQRATGIDPTPHEFRHSFCSLLRAEGIDPADLAAIAGHTLSTANAHYVHSLGRSFDAVREAVG